MRLHESQTAKILSHAEFFKHLCVIIAHACISKIFAYLEHIFSERFSERDEIVTAVSECILVCYGIIAVELATVIATPLGITVLSARSQRKLLIITCVVTS